MIQFPDKPDISGYGEKDRVFSNVSILGSNFIIETRSQNWRQKCYPPNHLQASETLQYQLAQPFINIKYERLKGRIKFAGIYGVCR